MLLRRGTVGVRTRDGVVVFGDEVIRWMTWRNAFTLVTHHDAIVHVARLGLNLLEFCGPVAKGIPANEEGGMPS